VGLGYNFSKTDNAAGPTLLNQNTGFGPSFNITYNIFNGFTLNHFIRNAKLNIQSYNLEFNDAKLQVSSNLLKAYKTYQTDLEALKLIEENYDLAKETVTVALERYRLGASSALDLSVAQQSYEDAENAVILARYDAKVAETELLCLNGQLVR
jgi:outer membrane protein TolC